jgi:aspartyl-tRNA(Asn)/glutamyl-tRNA(Gln) amidotransferase subunit A
MSKTMVTVKTIFGSGPFHPSVYTQSHAFQDLLSFYDSKDPTSALPAWRSQAQSHSSAIIERLQSQQNLTGLTIGIPEEYFPAELSSVVIDALRAVIVRLQALGARIVPVSLPSTSFALSAYYVLASAEASSNLARYDGVQFGECSVFEFYY